MKIHDHRVPCYLVGLSFFNKWNGREHSCWTEYSVVIPHRPGRSDGGEPIKVKFDPSNQAFEWLSADGLLESLDLDEKTYRMMNLKMCESSNGLSVRQTKGAFSPGMDVLLEPFLVFQPSRGNGVARMRF